MSFRVEIAGLNIDPSTRTPILILKRKDGDEAVPVAIGYLEAAAIAAVLRGEPSSRPMTHDLFHDVIRETGCRVIRIEITDLKEGTFYARILFGSEEADAFSMDARPSDAVALALRFDAPMFMAKAVLDQSVENVSGKQTADAGDYEAADTSEEGRKWAAYLENLQPDAFGKV